MFEIPWLAPDSAMVFGGSVILYGVLAWICYARGLRKPVHTAFVVSAAATAIIGVSLGWQGAAWDLTSTAIKFVVLLAACTMPSAVAAFVTLMIHFRSFAGRLIVGTICGVVTAAFTPLMMIGALCSALGDCL